MAQVGLPHTAIANIVGCDPKTLRKHCANELGAAKATGLRMLCNGLMTMSTGQRAIQYRKQDGTTATRYIDVGEKVQLNAMIQTLRLVFRSELERDADVPPDGDDGAFTVRIEPDRGASGEEDDPPAKMKG